MSDAPAGLIWFRRDLRMNDNPALAAGAEGPAICAFCFEPGLTGGRHASPNRNAYLLASLRELDANLRGAGSRLHVRRGDPAEEITRLAVEAGVRRVHVNRDHTAHARERDRRVEAALGSAGIELVAHTGITCAEPSRIETSSGGPFRVFTPFHRAWLDAPRRDLAPRPRRLRPPAGTSRIPVGRLPAAADVGVDAAAQRIAAAAGPGERAARRAIGRAVAAAAEYPEVRDLPGLDRTNRLSPALHFGTASARELESRLAAKRSDGAKALRRQLCWRDFWLNVIRSFPGNRESEYDRRFRGMRWRKDPEALSAWKEGATGEPWIDAGMRQLRAEGWMHNRVRMAVASYLTKNLLIDWREGEAHFMRHLLDGDEAQNNGNWQWAASVGADPQPWFRIFNPARQQQRFDPDGSYVRRWVPEAGSADYPEPLVDLSDSRNEALARFGEQRGRG